MESKVCKICSGPIICGRTIILSCDHQYHVKCYRKYFPFCLNCRKTNRNCNARFLSEKHIPNNNYKDKGNRTILNFMKN